MTSLARLRQLCATYAGPWAVSGLRVINPETSEIIATCESRWAASYLVALHEWALPLMNAVHELRKRLADARAMRAAEPDPAKARSGGRDPAPKARAK